ncbi:MAG: hypothetical protein L0Y76_04750, partial [Ignavibacteria bacterium]|nr:hypothetical protein [Ignavibacteria bacterium]
MLFKYANHPPDSISRQMLVIIFIIVFASFGGYAAEIGALHYSGEIGELKDSTVVVPEKTVALSNKIRAPYLHYVLNSLNATPSLFFIIDHSGSMFQQSYQSDQRGNRFTFTQTLIDTLQKCFPKAEIGIAVFREYLYFNHIDNTRFIQCPGNDTGAYLPFFRFDSTYAPDGKTGYQIVRELLDTEIKTDSTGYQYADLKYRPSNASINGTGANLNAGFDAAKHAFLTAKYPKNFQRIILFSNGEADVANGPHTNPWDFRDSVRNIPATLTVF